MKHRIRFWMICAALMACGCESETVSISGNSCDFCTSSERCCDGQCVDLQTDAAHCGSCDIACDPGISCVNARCATQCKPKTCETLGFECGPADDGCGGSLNCGSCESGNNCQSGHCAPIPGGCTPHSCADLNAECGSADDGCGGTLSCGECDSGWICENGSCIEQSQCTPRTCESLGFECGPAVDGCGGALSCGECSSGWICQDGRCIDQSQCTPKTCESLGLECGPAADGCGNAIRCGECNSGWFCQGGRCVEQSQCIPKTCTDLNAECGSIGDECGGTLSCGSCSSNLTCQNNRCAAACTPKSCAEQNANCGSIADGCGGTLSCGSCGSNQTCQNNKCVNTCQPKTCSSLGFTCGTASDNCGGTLNCGSCAGNQICESNQCRNSTAHTYPKRLSIKGLQPDFMDINQVAGNATHGVSMNMVWAFWQPTQTTTCVDGQVKYDGYCFTIGGDYQQRTISAIKEYSNRGVLVTAIVYGVPPWATISNCSSQKRVNDTFCAPADGKEVDYGRFAGFLAHLFNGEQGYGRIADFVIHNEVNNYQWFNPGYSDMNHADAQAAKYALSYNWAYDYIRKEQRQAKVLISFDHHFAQSHSGNGSYAVTDIMNRLVPKLGDREWLLAFHSYPPDLRQPAFGADDYFSNSNCKGCVTFGNIGIIAGWLRQNYPTKPHAWEIQLTENGINGTTTDMRKQQKTQLCQAFKNVLGTPGITSFIYHRLIDIAEEGLSLGLWDSSANPKPAWETFALSNQSGHLACGFEYLPYVEMMRGYNKSTGMHWVTTRQFPSGFAKEQSYKILREPADNTSMVYECRVGGANGKHTMISKDPNCEGQFNMGPMGYIYNSQVSGSVPIYRCATSGGSHFISPSGTCENQIFESLVGYAIP